MPTEAGAAPSRRKSRAGRSDTGRRCLSHRSDTAGKSLSRRLTRGFFATTAFGVLGAGVSCVLTLSYCLREHTDQQIVQNHRFRLQALRQGNGLPPAMDGSASVVTDARGAVQLSTGVMSLVGNLPIPAAELRERAAASRPAAVAHRPARAMVSRLPGGTYLVTARSTVSNEATVKTLVGIETAISIPLIAVLLLAALRNSRSVLACLRDLSRSARRIAEGGGEPMERVPVVTQPLRELQSTADTLNYLLRRIEEGSVRHRQEESRLCELVGAASHELRSPLTVITGYAQLARLGGLDDPHRLDQAMEQVQQQTWRMTRLVEDLLLLAGAGHGRVLEQHPVDLAELCVRAVAGAEITGARRSLRCVVESPTHLVAGDRHRLEQAIGNLLANVRVHTSEDTSAEVRLHLDGDRHVIDVIDDGPGVPETARERIFEPFFRAETATAPGSTPSPGRGLGLSVAAAVVRAHGGHLGLEPSERGAWFRVSLPALKERRRVGTAPSVALP
ncbi:sensor histidine kinase [Streptomyces sp. HD]|uniref:sensor histidine kinase n=1 Tax=Streptomyces sp. HD TaxID=3020892 RepID=UPI00232B51D6|nr:HAMP domain-containing sensor histidine kinase [Streptomyces sp. HD]MDC0771517.1 HAMP domain-containing sensor histidine kinase [Streptomyces sp. HD]